MQNEVQISAAAVAPVFASDNDDKDTLNCGGLAECAVQSMSVALRSAAARYEMERDIVALALRSYGGAYLTPKEIDHCVNMLCNALVIEASEEAGERVRLSTQLQQARAHLARVQNDLQTLRNKRRERLMQDYACTEFSDIVDNMVDLYDANGDELEQLERAVHKNNSLARNSTSLNKADDEHHSPLHHGVIPESPNSAERNAMCLNERAQRRREAEFNEAVYLRRNEQVQRALKERIFFFESLLVIANQPVHKEALKCTSMAALRAFEIDRAEAFAPLFLYAFAHSRTVRIQCCADFCDARPSHTRRLHPSRHNAFVSSMPALYEHYYAGHVRRSELVLLARHLHTFGFVPLLTSADVRLAMHTDLDQYIHKA